MPGEQKVTMFFPQTDNDGLPFGAETWRWWRRSLGELLSGFTELGVVRGWWLGRSDRNRWVVAVVASEQEVDRIREFLREARVVLRQDAMYLEYHPVQFEEAA